MGLDRFSLSLGIAVALPLVGAASVVVGCSDDNTGSLSRRTGAPGASSGGTDPNNPNGTGANGSGLAKEEELFNGLDAELSTKCGNACHTEATYKPPPPRFLEGADTASRYKSIKAFPGIVVADIYQSTILTKGAHAGPAMSTDPVFEKKVIDWLTAESLAMTAVGNPSTDPITLVNGPNEVPLDKASTGITGAKLKFDASVLSGMLSLSNMKVVAPAGTDTHVLKPRFIRVTADKQIADPADSFSNVDVTVAGGTEGTLGPGSALFSGDGWRPFDLAKDKIRIEAQKIEKGTVQVTVAPQTCKNVAMFQANVLPALRGTGFTPNCNNCHNNGLAGMSLGSNDAALVCTQVMSKLNQANIGASVIVTKVTAGPHNGGLISDANAWRTLFTNNAAAFF